MKTTRKSEQQGCFGSSTGATTTTADPAQPTEFWDSCEDFLYIVLLPLLDCLKKKLCTAPPEVKQEILAQIKVYELHTNSKADLLMQLKERKKELELVGGGKGPDEDWATASASGKLPMMCGEPVRLSKL